MWSFTTGGDILGSATLSSDGSHVYIVSYDDKLYKVRTSDGAQVWSFTTGGDIWGSATLSSDGSHVYIVSTDDKLYKIYA